ncbi:hypothetical protein B0H34DRAFT_192293 [Crassisporium funariophilum]|nr:hypothetical protein B0H34DRAFT_192293 [Crassisporium funariophilum]
MSNNLPQTSLPRLLFQLKYFDISAARRALHKLELNFVDISYLTRLAYEKGGAAQGAAMTEIIPSPAHQIHPPNGPEYLDSIFGRPGTAFTSTCFCVPNFRDFGRAASAQPALIGFRSQLQSHYTGVSVGRSRAERGDDFRQHYYF